MFSILRLLQQQLMDGNMHTLDTNDLNRIPDELQPNAVQYTDENGNERWVVSSDKVIKMKELEDI